MSDTKATATLSDEDRITLEPWARGEKATQQTKYPGPWRIEDNCVVDANGGTVLVDAMGIQGDEAKLVILAAWKVPQLERDREELLAALREMVDHGENVSLHTRAEALIARIVGK